MAGSYRPVIAIAGLNGILGQQTLAALLSPQFINSFQLPIRVLTRVAADIRGHPYTSDLAAYLGVDYDDPESLDAALEEVDVVINLLGVYPRSWIALGESAHRVGASLYIPSEFGPDHRKINYQNPFAQKQVQSDRPRENGLKTVQIFCGIIMEYAIPTGHHLGIDLLSRRIKAAVQGPSRREPTVSFTSVRDVAMTVASVASRSPSTLPDVVRVAGDSLTLRRLGEHYSSLVGASVQVTIFDVAAFSNPPLCDIGGHYQLAAGAGLLDHSKDNSNEWINAGRWQWKSVQHLLTAIQPPSTIRRTSPPVTRGALRRRLEAQQAEAEAATAATTQDRRSTLRSHTRMQATGGRGTGTGTRGGRAGNR